MSDQTSSKIDIEALEDAKRQALEKVKELDNFIAQVKNQTNSQPTSPNEATPKEEPVVSTPVQQDVQQEPEPEVQTETPVQEVAQPQVEETKPEPIVNQETTEDKPKLSKKEQRIKEKEQKRISKSKHEKEKEQEQLSALAKSIANRTKGKVKAEPGNTKLRQTNSEVFIFLVDDNELQLKVLKEQFKNSRSFKQTKAFTNGKTLLKYLKTRKFPKRSILIVIMDYFLENSDDEEAQNGITVLNQIKEYDPSIEVIMLSSNSDVDVATSAAHFGAVTFIQKGNDAMKKILNNILWIIKDKDQIQKKADSKSFIRGLIIIFALLIATLMGVDTALDGKLGIAFWAQKAPTIQQAPAAPTPAAETESESASDESVTDETGQEEAETAE